MFICCLRWIQNELDGHCKQNFLKEHCAQGNDGVYETRAGTLTSACPRRLCCFLALFLGALFPPQTKPLYEVQHCVM